MKQELAVILSGGSEMVTLGLVEALLDQNIEVVIVELGISSILRNEARIKSFFHWEWPCANNLAGASALEEIASASLASKSFENIFLFASEDGGMRLIADNAATLRERFLFTTCRNLASCGYDKLEVFRCLQASAASKYCARFLELDSFADVENGLGDLGDSFVVKPSRKSFTVDIPAWNSKIFEIDRSTPDYPDTLSALGRSWGSAATWVAQERLIRPPEGEFECYGVRDEFGDFRCTTAVEIVKYPDSGGGGCFVVLTPIAEISRIGYEVAEALDLIGLCEMSFLRSSTGSWKLVEANCRPWLQIALPEAAGFPIVRLACQALRGSALSDIQYPVVFAKTFWCWPERLLQRAFASPWRRRFSEIFGAFSMIIKSDIRVPYSSTIGGSTSLWLGKLVKRIVFR